MEEVQQLTGTSIKIRSLIEIGCAEELPETQNTIEGNALQKAQYVFKKFKTPCFADDTGLEVESLNGEPGVFSARYAGEHRSSQDNIDLLLQRLKGQPNRNAQFRCVIALVDAGVPVLFEGIVKGKIIETPRGAHGFGYDSIFQPAGFSSTLAEMTMKEKNAISHRGIAVMKLVQHLKKNYAR